VKGVANLLQVVPSAERKAVKRSDDDFRVDNSHCRRRPRGCEAEAHEHARS
jgi:hypothetical protein